MYSYPCIHHSSLPNAMACLELARASNRLLRSVWYREHGPEWLKTTSRTTRRAASVDDFRFHVDAAEPESFVDDKVDSVENLESLRRLSTQTTLSSLSTMFGPLSVTLVSRLVKGRAVLAEKC